MIAPKPSINLCAHESNLYDFLNAIYKDEKELFKVFPYLSGYTKYYLDVETIQLMYDIFAKQKRSDLQYIYDKMVLYHMMFENNQDVHQYLFSSNIKDAVRVVGDMLRDLGRDFDFKFSNHESKKDENNPEDSSDNKLIHGYQLMKIQLMELKQKNSELNQRLHQLEQNSQPLLIKIKEQCIFTTLYIWTLMNIVSRMFLNFTVKVGDYPFSIIENAVGYIQLNRRNVRIVLGLLVYLWIFAGIRYSKKQLDMYVINMIQNNIADPNVCLI